MPHDMSVAERFVAFTYALRLDDVPQTERRQATRLLADTLACAVAARGTGIAARISAYVAEHASGSEPRATLLAGEGDADLPGASLANTAAVRELDANDIYCSRVPTADMGHFSDVIPAILAAAEPSGASGAQVLAAIIAAYEIQALLCDTTDWTHHAWHTASLVAWAAPASIAHLLGASPDVAATAISIAGTTGQALQSWLRPDRPVTAMKSVAPGLAAQRAMQAVDLARLGVSAPDDALETMLRHLGGDPASVAVQRLGDTWTLSRNLIKRYPAQFNTQAAVQAACELHLQGVREADIAHITIAGHAGVCGSVQGSARAYAPVSREDADHSTPFVVAMALLHGRLTPADYDGAPWRDPAVLALMRRIQLVVEPERERARIERGVIGCRVAATLRNGSVQIADVTQPAGHPDAPLDDAGLLAKMRELIGDRLGSDGPERLLAACDALAAAPNIDDLLRLLSVGKAV